MAVVAFDSALFCAGYPEFAALSPKTLEAYFMRATIYEPNGDNAPESDVTVRAMLLNMLVAHIAALANAQLVGRVSQATEGSVSVTAEMAAPSKDSDWFKQTKYGAEYWQAIAPRRTFRYFPGSSRRSCA